MRKYVKKEPILLCFECTCQLKHIFPSQRSNYKSLCNKKTYNFIEENKEFRHDSPLELYMIEKYGDKWVYGLNTL